MKIDKDIQEAVADEFCKRLGDGTLSLIDGVSWSVAEMRKRQEEREKKK